jgi:hypothetical protein
MTGQEMMPKRMALGWSAMAFVLQAAVVAGTSLITWGSMATRLAAIESRGTPQLTQHVADSDKRHESHHGRITGLEREAQLRGAQLDRMESKIDQILSRAAR